LQHLNTNTYYQYKLDIIKNAVSYAGFETNLVKDLIKIGQGCRRRATFQIGKNNELGFFQKESKEVVAIDYCLILRDELDQLIKPLKKLIKKLSKNNLQEIFLSFVDTNSIDLILKLKKELNFKEFEILKNFVDKNKISCLSYNLDDNLILVYRKKELEMRLGKSVVTPLLQGGKTDEVGLGGFDSIITVLNLPAGVFLQATIQGQNAITKEVINALKDCQNVLDLYSGVGTYSFPLSYFVNKVVSVEGDRDMVESIKQNILSNNLNNKIEAFSRDLVARPLTEERLNEFDGVIINPPRSGAKAQCEFIAKSKISKVVLVSCNPSAFSTDAKILGQGGYKLTKVIGIDQFYWSFHLEIIGVFVK